MSFPRFATRDPSTMTMDQLFPEQFAASRRMIVRDFAVYFTAIVVGVVAIVAIHG